jgi:hypothetical protein
MRPAEYDAGGVLPAGTTARNNTGQAERVIPNEVLACTWPVGNHSEACDWRLHVELHNQGWRSGR